MGCEQVSLHLLSLCLPLSQARGSLWLCVRVNGDPVEILQQPNYEERHFVVGELNDPSGCTWSVCKANKGLNKIHTCWPRQILGPAPKGRKIKGFGTRYFFNRSSMNRSGSNLSAGGQLVTTCRKGRYDYTNAYHQGPKGLSYGA